MTNDQGRNGYVQPRIGVVYICDSNYHNITLYSIASIARSQSINLDFFVIQHGYSCDAPPAFHERIKSHSHTLSLLNLSNIASPLPIEPHQEKYAHISSTMFLKNHAIDLLADRYDYVLYLDGDVLVFDDLHCNHLAGFAETAAASLDLSSATGFDDPTFFSNCERNGVSANFFNSGVFMVNTRKWRAAHVSEHYAENLLRHEDSCPYFSTCTSNDQCALNMTLGSDLKLMPVSWNVQNSALHTQAWETAMVRHYTGAKKFLPVRARTCDPRQYTLLSAITNEYGLPTLRGRHDFGILYALNKIRRRKTVAKYERAISAINAALATTG